MKHSLLVMTTLIAVSIGSYAQHDTTAKDMQAIAKESNHDPSLIGIGDESILDDDGSASQEISPMVVLSDDQYLNNVRYQLSQFRFKVRGYDNVYEQKYINGVSFNDQQRGVFNFASIGALNDITRNGEAVSYHTPNTFTYGSIGGTENIDMRAGSYAKGTKISMSYTNRNYYLRSMVSYSTGLRDDGWAFTASAGGRYSDEGHIDGTFYRNFAYALAAEKQWDNGRQSLSFTTFGSPVERGQQSASYQEIYNLRGDNLYNPNWGWLNGDKRNAKVVKAFDPTAIMSHTWKITPTATLVSGIGAHYARYGNTALNWYNGPDPRPDYYRYLPSYHAENETIHNNYVELWSAQPSPVAQINWYEMYRANELADRNGESGVYMVEERRSDLFEVSLNSTLNIQPAKGNKITMGIGVRTSESKQFKTIDDMLGATYFVDIDKFAERDFPGNGQVIQNNLERPGRRVYEGDTFGYDFRIRTNSANIWVQNRYSTRRIDFYYGLKITYTDFQRKGEMKNGRYPDNSLGKGKKHSFVDFAAKAGATYKITGRHLITANINYTTQAPRPHEAYVSPRISNHAVDGLESGKIFSADLNYVFSTPVVKGRVSVYQTNFYDLVQRKSYYHDSERTFVNHVLTGMNKTNRGVEIGVNIKLDNRWSVDVAGTMAEYFYSNNPDGTISYENGKVTDIKEKVYLNNYYVGATPQIAGTVGVNYYYKNWFVNLNINGLARNYIDISPLRRLASNYEEVNPNNPEELEAYQFLTRQERFGSAATIDLSVGKIIYLPGGRAINFNFAFNNLTNRKDIRTGGFEQGRMDITSSRKFNSKYYYMQGLNCFLNMSYRF